MIFEPEQILNIYSILINRHQKVIDTLSEKAKTNLLNATEEVELSAAQKALNTYQVSKNTMIKNWTK